MRYSKEEIIDWVAKTILGIKERKRRTNSDILDYLLHRVDTLIKAEEEYHLPGGTTYSRVMKQSLLALRSNMELGNISQNLISERLNALNRRLTEAIEIFKKGR